jgi:hypothetical protein
MALESPSYDTVSDTPRCTFCDKRSFEISGLVEGKRAAICRECVEDFYRGLNDEFDSATPSENRFSKGQLRAILAASKRTVATAGCGSTRAYRAQHYPRWTSAGLFC